MQKLDWNWGGQGLIKRRDYDRNNRWEVTMPGYFSRSSFSTHNSAIDYFRQGEVCPADLLLIRVDKIDVGQTPLAAEPSINVTEHTIVIMEDVRSGSCWERSGVHWQKVEYRSPTLEKVSKYKKQLHPKWSRGPTWSV